jgi:putative cardiolipin synthase
VDLIAERPGRSGVYVLEKGEESLLARAWLADHAVERIDVQYFIWSSDNVGRLAAEGLLRAAERGVRVRVLVDDLLIDASDTSLLALARHPNVSIRIYNPLHTVGVSFWQRVRNALFRFRALNQRMHDKTVSVDGIVAVLGGRNMADEYYDYDHAYNFRDRDVLLLGPVVADIEASFERFWHSEWAVPVERQLADALATLDETDVARVHGQLHEYARDPANFAPAVREALADISEDFEAVLAGLVWEPVRFVSDDPGKNPGRDGLGGGGATTRALVEVLEGARERVVIQTPYLVLPEGGLELFAGLVQRGVSVEISTNSLAATDNLPAFSGYHRQRRAILDAGIDVFEFQPYPEIQRDLQTRYPQLAERSPVFALHAKTLVVDGRSLFIGTFNLDPRSANLNTEVGALIDNEALAAEVEASIRRDMQPGNSWNARSDDPDTHADWPRRLKLYLWRMLPLDALL